MATNRKRTPRGRKAIEPLSPALLHYFMHGYPLIRSLEGYPECLGPIFFEREKLQAIWEEHRDQIAAKNPGMVPYYQERTRRR